KALFLKNGYTVLENSPAQIPEFVSATLGKIVGHENRKFHLTRRFSMLLKECRFLIDDLVKDFTSAWHRIPSCRAFDEVGIFDLNTSETPLADTKRDLGRVRQIEF